MTELNSLNHFDFYYSYSSGTYEFKTEEEITYIITFIDYSDVMGGQFPVYSLIIDNHN